MTNPQPPQDLRALKTLVAGLGILIILGTALVIGVIIHRIYAKPAAPSNLIPPSPSLSTTLPAGFHIESIAPAGQDLAILASSPDGERVYLLDPATGSLTQAVAAAR
jgi:hypothetical protein